MFHNSNYPKGSLSFLNETTLPLSSFIHQVSLKIKLLTTLSLLNHFLILLFMSRCYISQSIHSFHNLLPVNIVLWVSSKRSVWRISKLSVFRNDLAEISFHLLICFEPKSCLKTCFNILLIRSWLYLNSLIFAHFI